MLGLLLFCAASVASVPLEYAIPAPPSLPASPYAAAVPYPDERPIVVEDTPIHHPTLFAPRPTPSIPELPQYVEQEVVRPEEVPVITGPYVDAVREMFGPYSVPQEGEFFSIVPVHIPEVPISVGHYPEEVPLPAVAAPVVPERYPEAVPVVPERYPEAIPVTEAPYPAAIPVVTGSYIDAVEINPAHIYDAESGSLVLPVGNRVEIRDEKGQFSNGYALPDGTQVSEEGRLITTNGGWEYVIAKTGSYSYVSPEGKVIDVKWVADENGFRHI